MFERTSAFLAERSKALVSSSSIFGCVGSNPTECILKNTYSKQMFKEQALDLNSDSSLCILILAHLPEWSKGLDLSSSIFVCVGSNPTVCTLKETSSNSIKQ